MASVVENLNGFVGAQAKLQSFTPTEILGKAIYKFNSPNAQMVPMEDFGILYK